MRVDGKANNKDGIEREYIRDPVNVTGSLYQSSYIVYYRYLQNKQKFFIVETNKKFFLISEKLSRIIIAHKKTIKLKNILITHYTKNIQNVKKIIDCILDHLICK